MKNGDKVREALSKLSDYKISHLEFCNLYDECDECRHEVACDSICTQFAERWTE
jgi:hypothetical protein